MAIKYKGIGHIALRCKDFETEDKFYSDKLGLKKSDKHCSENGEGHIVYYRLPSGQNIELYHGSNDNYTGDNKLCERSHFHCCLEVGDRNAAIKYLEDKGVFVYRAADDSVGQCGSYCMGISDPENNQWELMQFSAGSKQILCDK